MMVIEILIYHQVQVWSPKTQGLRSGMSMNAHAMVEKTPTQSIHIK